MIDMQRGDVVQVAGRQVDIDHRSADGTYWVGYDREGFPVPVFPNDDTVVVLERESDCG